MEPAEAGLVAASQFSQRAACPGGRDRRRGLGIGAIFGRAAVAAQIARAAMTGTT
jgi:hypothetical protein